MTCANRQIEILHYFIVTSAVANARQYSTHYAPSNSPLILFTQHSSIEKGLSIKYNSPFCLTLPLSDLRVFWLHYTISLLCIDKKKLSWSMLVQNSFVEMSMSHRTFCYRVLNLYDGILIEMFSC